MQQRRTQKIMENEFLITSMKRAQNIKKEGEENRLFSTIQKFSLPKNKICFSYTTAMNVWLSYV